MVYAQAGIHFGEWDAQCSLGFKIQTDHLISARRPVIVNEKKDRIYQIVDFALPVNHRVKLKESEKRDKYLDIAIELKYTENEAASDTCCNWIAQNNPQRFGKRTRRRGNKRKSGNH